MAEQLILFQAEELSDVKAKYNDMTEEIQTIGNNLRAAEGRLNGCLSAMESVAGAHGGSEYFYNSTWADQQHTGIDSILSVIQRAIDLTTETDGSLRGKITGAAEGAAAGPVTSSGDTSIQTQTATATVAAATAAIASISGFAGLASAGFASLAATTMAAGSGTAATVAGGAAAAAGTIIAGIGAANEGAGGTGNTAAAKPQQTTIGKNMERRTSIKTKNSSGKAVTVKGTYDVVKNVDKYALDQRNYVARACTATSWAMTRNINDGKTTLKPMDKSNWGSGGCTFPGSTSVAGSNQKMFSAAYGQLQQGKVCTIYGMHPVKGKSEPHAVTIVGVKPTADPKNLKMSDFLVIDPWGGTTKNMSDVKYTSLTRVYIDKT